MKVSGKAGVIVILAAGGLGFIIALAGSPGIGSPRSEVVYVSHVVVEPAADGPQ